MQILFQLYSTKSAFRKNLCESCLLYSTKVLSNYIPRKCFPIIFHESAENLFVLIQVDYDQRWGKNGPQGRFFSQRWS